MEFKHPVSVLQELMAKQYKDLPKYEIIDISTNLSPAFRCTVKADGIIGVADSSAKQAAKRQAALHALSNLGYSNLSKMTTAVLSKTSPNVVITDTVSYNAIGTLNEFAAAKRVSYPTYIEDGVDNKGEFIITCQLLNDLSVGCAPTKKAAKQLAAHHMLKRLEGKALIHSIPVPPSQQNLDDISDDIVLAKFNELTIYRKKLPPPSNKPETCSSSSSTNTSPTRPDLPIKDLPKTEKTPTVSRKTIDEMYVELKRFTTSYTIDIIARNPFVLIMKFKNEYCTTVVETGDTYEEAHTNLLQKAIMVIRAIDQEHTI